MQHIKTIVKAPLKNVKHTACGECQSACQSACKTSCTVGNLSCQKPGGEPPQAILSYLDKQATL